ncbi:hypothetical protein L596_026271 [Steinernema carpocapsae]|uniref:Uncharacterized protein n=1 Tax=Steinernema carpocapsae TaxID=34508 RepID=A0A4U5M0V2_STECR|nr:hypothetical protein L596_026271 [Steinernema carpocapsae]
MMRPSISVYLALVLLSLCVANPNNWYYATSADTCGQENCPPANWWRFHTCYEQKCEYHLQPWFPALILVIACAIVSSLVSCLVRTLCCCCECGRNPRSAHYYA